MYAKIVTAVLMFSCSCSMAQLKPGVNIGERTFNFRDDARQRPLVTEVWYPTADTPRNTDKIFSPFMRRYTVRNGPLPQKQLPLILLSHGTGGGRLTLEWLCQGLAQRGFIVAAVDHWGNTFDNKIPVEFVKPWERPLDISFVLTALLADASMKAVIDTQKIGAIGFSFGGYTVLALAGGVLNYDTLIHYYQTSGHKEIETPEMKGSARFLEDSALVAAMHQVPSLADTRIKAFFSISPALGAGFTTAHQFKQVHRPVLIVGSSSDSMAPVVSNARHYHELIAGCGYYEFPGKTGHYVMLGEAIDDIKKSDPIYFADDPSVSRAEVHTQVCWLAGDFFSQKLR